MYPCNSTLLIPVQSKLTTLGYNPIQSDEEIYDEKRNGAESVNQTPATLMQCKATSAFITSPNCSTQKEEKRLEGKAMQGKNRSHVLLLTTA